MGLEINHIISSESHYGSFLCTICQNLCDLNAIVTISCSHVFCRTCIETWLSHKNSQSSSSLLTPPTRPRCPTCNNDLSSPIRNMNKQPKTMIIGSETIDAYPLSDAQPLAYRVLKRVRVSCPLLEKHGCLWQGDYGDLTGHLLSDSNHRVGVDCDNDRKQQQQMDVDDNAEDVIRRNDDERTRRADLQHNPAAADDVNDNDDGKRRRLAQSFKEEGNTKFSCGNIADARDLYSKAFSLLVGQRIMTKLNDDDVKLLCTILANRSATHLKLKNYQDCINDCDYVLQRDASFTKAYFRKSKALIQLGLFPSAISTLSTGIALNPSQTSKTLTDELSNATMIQNQMTIGKTHLRNQNYTAAKSCFASLLALTTAPSVMLAAAHAAIGMGHTDQAMRLTLRVVRENTTDARGFRLRGHAAFFSGDFENAASLLKEALRLDPDRGGVKRLLKRCRSVGVCWREGTGCVFHRRFEEGVRLFSEALEICRCCDGGTTTRRAEGDDDDDDELMALPSKAPLYGQLYVARAGAYLRLKDYDKTLRDVSLVLYARDDVIPAHLLKIKAYRGLGRYDDAMQEVTELMQQWGNTNDDVRKEYETTSFESRKRNRVNYYELLGVPTIASEMEIKREYKKRAMEYHPDRLAGGEYTEAQRKEAENKFKLLGEGLEILTNEFKRQLYDKGYDHEAIRERVSAAQEAANRDSSHYHHRGRY